MFHQKTISNHIRLLAFSRLNSKRLNLMLIKYVEEIIGCGMDNMMHDLTNLQILFQVALEGKLFTKKIFAYFLTNKLQTKTKHWRILHLQAGSLQLSRTSWRASMRWKQAIAVTSREESTSAQFALKLLTHWRECVGFFAQFDVSTCVRSCSSTREMMRWLPPFSWRVTFLLLYSLKTWLHLLRRHFMSGNVGSVNKIITILVAARVCTL